MYKVTKENNMKIHCIQLLTVGGTSLWEEAKGTSLKVVEENDLYRKEDSTVMVLPNEVHLCEIDPQKTKIQDFYQWNELSTADDSTFCWRHFFYLEGDKQECWLHAPGEETLSKVPVQRILETIVHSKVI
jgi:hypothetical protein